MYFSPIEFTLKSLYNILTHIAAFHLKLIAPFNNKLQKGVTGRALTFNTLRSKIKSNDNVIWFHCASLGEYEQGLPVFEKIRSQYHTHKIVLSFFSPSGYEIRKNTPIADVVVYLPLDTTKNAKQFLDLIHPELIVFVKYEFWPNYLNEIKHRNIKAILISALFRNDQSFFKPYGKWMQPYLFAFDHIFVQNKTSETLLKSIDYTNVSVSGDTRFDRVSNQLNIDNSLDFIETFKDQKLCVVAGSTWPEGEKLLIEYINNCTTDTKFIIAPHNIKPQQIHSLVSKLKKDVVLFSKKEDVDLKKADVFIADTIGILSKIYSYADIAYVGGALGNTGLHNTLEPAVFGIPIIIGNNYDNFPEAHEMKTNGGLFTINNQKEFNIKMNDLIHDPDLRLKAGKANSDYISKNKGAVSSIIDYLTL